MEQTGEREEQEYLSAKLKDALELDGDPVAISIVSDVPQELNNRQRKATLCMSIQSARRGLAFYCSGKDIICNGKAHIGIGKPPMWDMEDLLVHREKIVGSKTAARRMLDLARVQTSTVGKYIVLAPLTKASLNPDVVVFVATPLQISRILFLDAFETGEINLLHREPLCSGVIAIPITSGRIGVSFLDMSCRSFGQYRPEEMAIGVPYSRLPNIVSNIDHSIAGTAKSSFLLRLLPSILNSNRSGQITSQK
jgi:uncharacterized protein (DUF169 family)